MKGKTIAIIVAIILVLAIGYYFISREAKAPEEVSNVNQSSQLIVPQEDTSTTPETAASTQPPVSTPPPPGSTFSDEDDIQPPPPTPPATPSPTPPPTQIAAKTVTVAYDGTSFSPKTVIIKQGDTVVFKNNSSGNFRPASDPHPSHTAYPGFDAGSAVAAGGTYSFEFAKLGEWGYHNHLNSSQGGTVVVQ